ncbi:protein YgfX [Vibrio sinus]
MTVIVFAVCACVVSFFPLAPSIYIIGLVLCYARDYECLPKSISGRADISSNGELTLSGNKFVSQKTLFLYAPLFIVFISKHGQKFSLWRDSLSDDEYRKVLVYLRYGRE